MTQNQKFLKLGTGQPTKKVRRRMERRGVNYLRPFRDRHLRRLEEAKKHAASTC